MNLLSLNQMTSKVPKCARPWGLILNDGFLTDRKCLHITFQVTDGQTRPAHHHLGDNTLFTNLFSVHPLIAPGGKFLLSPFCFWENWSLERVDDLTRSHNEDLKDPETLAPIPGPRVHCWARRHFTGWGTPSVPLGQQCPVLQYPTHFKMVGAVRYKLWTCERTLTNTTLNLPFNPPFFFFFPITAYAAKPWKISGVKTTHS